MLELAAVFLLLLVVADHRPRFTPPGKESVERSQKEVTLAAATFALMGVLIGFTFWVLLTQ